MNKGIFRLIFNKRQGMLVPMAEISPAQGKSAAGETARPYAPHLKLIAILVAALGAATAWANPSGPTVVNGSATFNQSGNTLTVTNTPNAIINWNSFSIGQNEIAKFVQQSSASAVLNRVTGQDPSQILGQLQSNGRVFLINPNGVLFGQGARIDVAGLVASSLDIGNEDFLAGRYKFVGKGSEGAVKNAGNITTSSGGQVILIAPDVENSGIIVSPDGEVILAAGHSVELAHTDNPALRVAITALAGKAVNLGTIMAAGGKIGMYAGVVQQFGRIDASSAQAQGGRIFLKSSQSTSLGEGSVTAADGATGGGTVHVLSEGRTEVHGDITANGGDGFVETSAPEIDLAGATVRADQGGKWLIDPTDIAIEAYCSIGISLNCLSAYDISNTLSEGTSVVIATSGDGTENGDISVNGAIDGYGHGSTLTLDAHGGIGINADIAVDSLILLAGAGNIEQVYDDPEASIHTDFLAFDAHGDVGLGNRSNRVKSVAGRAGSDIVLATDGDLAIVNRANLQASPLALSPSLLSALSGLSADGSITVETGQNLNVEADIIAGHAIRLTAGDDLIQSGGAIKTTDTTGPGDIELFGRDITLTSVRSMRDIDVTAEGDITLTIGSVTTGGAGAMNFKDIDDEYFAYDLPFTFTYYGEEYDQIYISSNGIVTFGQGSWEYTNSTSGLKAGAPGDTTTQAGVKTIAPAWDDWVTYSCQDTACGQPTGWDVYVLPGTDALTIRWNVGHYENTSVHAIFETVLYKDGGIQYNYGPANLVSPSPNPQYPFLAQPTPSIGLASGDNSHFTLSSHNPADDVVLDMNYLNSLKYVYDAGTGNFIETVLATSGLGNAVENTAIGLHGQNVTLNAGGQVRSTSGLQDITAANKLTINANDGVGTDVTPLKIQAALLRVSNGANGVVNLINNGDTVVEGIRSGGIGKVSLDASGTILLRGGNDDGVIDAIDTQGDAALRAGADIVIGDPSTPALSANIKAANLEMTAGGRIIKNANSSVAADLTMNGGILGGSGTIDGDVTLGGDAKLAPGSSPGSLTITGDLTLGAGTTTDIELWGAMPGTGFDTVNVGGTVNLGGTLVASLGNGYVPGSEVAHEFLSAGTIVGDFASKSLPTGFTRTSSPTGMALVSGAIVSDIHTPPIARAIDLIDNSIQLGLDTPLFDDRARFELEPGSGPGSTHRPTGDADSLFNQLIHDASEQEWTDENSLVCR